MALRLSNLPVSHIKKLIVKDIGKASVSIRHFAERTIKTKTGLRVLSITKGILSPAEQQNICCTEHLENNDD